MFFCTMKVELVITSIYQLQIPAYSWEMPTRPKPRYTNEIIPLSDMYKLISQTEHWLMAIPLESTVH